MRNQYTALTICGVAQAGADILLSEIREVCQYLFM